MDRRWLPLNALRAFEAVGQHLSFTAAANSLTVAQSAVSRHVIVLENFLGVPLFERRPGQLALTEAGRHILPAVSKSFDRIDQALGEVIKEKGRPKRDLRVALPTGFAHRLAVPMLRDFRAAHPGVTLEIVTASNDEDVDIAIVYSQPRVSEAVHDLLWTARSTILCSPSLMEGLESGDPAELIATRDLLHVASEDKPKYHLWRAFVHSIGRADLPVDRGVVFDQAPLAVQYAIAGQGVALADPLLFEDELTAGRLVRPFDLWLDEGFGYYLSTRPEDLSSEAVDLFRTWLIARFAGFGGVPMAEVEQPQAYPVPAGPPRLRIAK